VDIRILLQKLKRVDRRRIPIIALGILLACRLGAFALDKSLDVSQYAHTAWKVSEGFSKGLIRSIAQTPDGYLWLGTEFGLVRFDGVRTVPWQPPAREHLPSSDIRSLLGARDGRLWIGTFKGLASWKDGTLTHYPELDGQIIEALLEDREGATWVAGWVPSVGRLCRIQSGVTQCYGQDGRFGFGVTALYEDSAGNLWVGEMNGVWRWKPGPPKLYAIPDPVNKIYSLTESDDGGILIAKTSGITKLRNGKTESYPLLAPPEFKPYRLLRDRSGGLWIGALVDNGLLHIHEGRTDLFNRSDGLSSNSVLSLQEDREGNIWVATGDGLDRFREFAVPTISVPQGLSGQNVSSVLALRDGSIWLGMSHGVNRWNKGQITIYSKRSVPRARAGSSVGELSARTGAIQEITDSGLPDATVEALFQDGRGQIWVGTQSGVAIFRSNRFFPITSVPDGLIYSIIADSAGNVWISHLDGLLNLLEERVVERIPWAQLGRREPATALLPDALQGGLWVGFRDGGVAYFKDGRFRASYAVADGLGEGWVRGFYVDRNGTLWVATDGGLSRIKDGRVLTLTSQNRLPCDTVHWMMEDDDNSVWLYLTCGLVRIDRSELDAWASNPKHSIQTTVFDTYDGVSNHQFTGGNNAVVAKSADGKIWFLGVGGVSVLDPRHLRVNKLPPPVHIEQVTADGQTYDATDGLRLPPNVKDLAIDYTALSFVAPEKVQMRVKLEGQDNDWRVPTNPRHAHYTNLGPGTYRFRVIASNNSGVWNEQGGSLDFSIAPAYYETRWFLASCVAAFVALLYGLYRLRLYQLAREFNTGLEARVNERTRIARDLHDTLLQSFHGLLLRFQTAYDLLPPDANEAREHLEKAIDQSIQAVTEGRQAVQALRTSTVESNDLAIAIRSIGQEVESGSHNRNVPGYQVEVKGKPRNLHPIMRDETYKIAVEAVRNAFQHAEARKIEVEIRYEERQFSVHIRDDGKGIDPEILTEGEREGHFGLHGMKERATIAGGKLAIWSEPGGGTEIEFTIPASTAYRTSRRKFRFSHNRIDPES
jgi:signal transduction histidine kinase/ligand-binding sensor domain-containing protein